MSIALPASQVAHPVMQKKVVQKKRLVSALVESR